MALGLPNTYTEYVPLDTLLASQLNNDNTNNKYIADHIYVDASASGAGSAITISARDTQTAIPGATVTATTVSGAKYEAILSSNYVRVANNTYHDRYLSIHKGSISGTTNQMAVSIASGTCQMPMVTRAIFTATSTSTKVLGAIALSAAGTTVTPEQWVLTVRRLS